MFLINNPFLNLIRTMCFKNTTRLYFVTRVKSSLYDKRKARLNRAHSSYSGIANEVFLKLDASSLRSSTIEILLSFVWKVNLNDR